MSAPQPPFALTHDERLSPLWRKLVKHMDGKLADLRASNDGEHDALATAKLRGRIAALKELLALDAEPDPNQPGPVTTDF
jgi:hypothetical protein